MIPQTVKWARPRHITDEEWWEITDTEPRLITAHLSPMDNYNHGWKCALYSRNERQVALALRYPRAIEAFRAACEQLKGETATFRGVEVEVVG